MVQTAAPEIAQTHEEGVLLWSKSKVYVKPTAYARDNIPGFVALVKQEALNPVYLLAWIPESLLNERGASEWEKFVRVEEKLTLESQDEEDVVVIDLPVQRPESYAFSVPLTSIYSLIVHAPSLSAWHGSIAINLANGDTLPTLYFHDDESRSFTVASPLPVPSSAPSHVTSYPPPAAPPPPAKTWGGEDLLARLRQYAQLMRSNLQASLYLVDPSRADIEAHSTQLFADDAVDDILAQSSFSNDYSPVPAHRRPRPLSSPPVTPPNPYSHRSSVLHRSLGHSPTGSQTASQARLALLQSFSNITRATRHAAQNILSHPLAKPIVPHLPDPVKSLINVNGDVQWGSWVEKGGVGEFDSARVYLAKWSRIVAEEGERARRREAEALAAATGETQEETSSLGVFELLHSTSNLPTPKTTRTPSRPVDLATWHSWFDEDGRPCIPIEKMKCEVFQRGFDSEGSVRRLAWPFLLGVFEWETSKAQRDLVWEQIRNVYHEYKSQWDGVPEVYDSPGVVDERHRIDVDCRRTDRNQPLFAETDESPTPTYSTISPQGNDFGAQPPTNQHIGRLGQILLTYNFFEKDLGYVQGMSDLCSPIYVAMEAEEEITFWCFVQVMKRMHPNFLRDQSGMKQQLSVLQQLIEIMDPELFRHLEKLDGLNLFFCYRWILIAFKREFPFDDVLKLWEVLWTDYYSSRMVLFVALAVLESHREMIMRYLADFDELLYYCHQLSNSIELDATLAQAEVLFLSFSQIVDDADQRAASEGSIPGPSQSSLRQRFDRGKASSPASQLISSDLRDLLASK